MPSSMKVKKKYTILISFHPASSLPTRIGPEKKELSGAIYIVPKNGWGTA